jgi:hypothetical protein
MRDTLRQHTRNWHARPGSSRPFPVRHDPILRADNKGPGGLTKRLSRAGLLSRSARLAVCAAATLLCLASAAAAASGPESGPWVGLAGGRMGHVKWSVKIARSLGPADAGSSAAKRPCLQVGTKFERSRFEYQSSRYQGCVDGSNGLAATEAPLIVTGAQASAGLRVKLTAVGILASWAARRVEIDYEDGHRETIHLQQPSPSQRQGAGLVRFRYAAFAIPGTWSVQRVVTESASGRPLWNSTAAG